MRKLRKAAVVTAAVLGTVGFLGAGAGTASANGGGGYCKSHDFDINVLNVALANGLAGNLLNGEGNPGAQVNRVGSDMGCGHGGW
ncbi:hypothetical protein ACIQNI_25395 [Streptomyces sp. NPDC091266]|uniref:hypothetical protein n=1 Tax=Streptomyces sp. NPDC091266 TaxID=3365978 RepID=UPI00381C636C